jgi:DNA polymerase-1
MLNVHRHLKKENLRSRMLLQIHDELVFEAPQDELQKLATLVTKEMTTAIPLDVPIQVDVAVGKNWLDVEPLSVGGSKTGNGA